jgi:hypothetical protein
MNNSGNIGSNNRSASVPANLKSLKKTLTNSPTIDAKTFFGSFVLLTETLKI